MGLWSRALLIMRVKGRVVLDKAENPVEVLGYADEQQQELLRRVKQGMIEVAISKRQLQQQVDMLDRKLPKVENQARRVLSAGREDLARIAVGRKQQVLTLGLPPWQVNASDCAPNNCVLATFFVSESHQWQYILTEIHFADINTRHCRNPL